MKKIKIIAIILIFLLPVLFYINKKATKAIMNSYPQITNKNNLSKETSDKPEPWLFNNSSSVLLSEIKFKEKELKQSLLEAGEGKCHLGLSGTLGEYVTDTSGKKIVLIKTKNPQLLDSKFPIPRGASLKEIEKINTNYFYITGINWGYQLRTSFNDSADCDGFLCKGDYYIDFEYDFNHMKSVLTSSEIKSIQGSNFYPSNKKSFQKLNPKAKIYTFIIDQKLFKESKTSNCDLMRQQLETPN